MAQASERILRSSRLSKDEYFLRMAELVAQRSTCARRAVGCVLVNSFGHVMSTGYNGVSRGEPHCISHNCAGATLKSGHGLELCQAIHAEENAMIQCRNITEIDVAYITASPCVPCIRRLANTSVNRIVFRELYPHPEAAIIAQRHSIDWVHLP